MNPSICEAAAVGGAGNIAVAQPQQAHADAQ